MEYFKNDRSKNIFRKMKQRLNEEGFTPDAQLLSSMIHSMPLNVFAKDREGTFIYTNDFYCKSVGKTYQEVIGKNDYDIHPEELADKYREDDRRIMASRQAESIEEPWQHLGGSYSYIQVIKSPLFNNINREKVIGIIGIFWDITDRKKTEIQLAEERNLLRTLIDIVPDYIYVKDRESRFIVANKAVAHLMGAGGPDDLIGKTDHDYYLTTYADNFRHDELHVIKEEVPLLYKEESYRDPEGKVGWIKTSKLPLHNLENDVVGVVGIGHDITKEKENERERRRLEKQLQHAQKMETVGTLAGGLAHDFNNLLMGIQGHASLMETELDDDHPFWVHLKAIERCVKSANELNNQLLGFARGGKYEVKPIALNEFIDDTVEMFGRTRKELRIKKAFAPGLWIVEADRRQIEQVLLNLLINAWQAMGASGGRDIYLKTENVMLDESYVAPHETAPGRYAKISVTDTGKGMDERTRERIFDPFFTTKEIGRGTGLGLASAYGIIKNHDGMITVYSEPGQGTTFCIYLPASDKNTPQELAPDETIFKGSETILLVDDEESIRQVGRELLEAMGYRVLEAGNGEEAIEPYRKNQDDIDIVLLEMAMHKKGGDLACVRLKEMNPSIKVLLVGSSSIEGEAREVLRKSCDGFIEKPFNMKRLSAKIREIVDKK